MYEFKVSAPGIVFLYGGPKLEIIEYNKSCLAAGLDIRTKLEFVQGSSPSPGVESNETIRIKFKNLKLYLEIPLEAIYKCFYDQNGVREFSCENLMNTIEEFIKSLNIPDNTYDPTNEVQNSFLKSFLYLLLHMAYEENIKITASVIMKLSTDLPIAKGLGTTTSFIVCLAACFWRWSLLQKGIARNTFDSQDCIKIRRYVWRCEKIVYNFKNMINNFISVYGVMVMYKDEIDKFTLHKIEPIRILIVDSNIKEIRIDQLKEMENLSQYADPIITRAALDKSFEAVEQIFQEFRKENRKRNDTNLADPLGLKSYHIKTILNFININQNILKAGGLSNQNIDFICEIAQKYSLECKMTGTGGYVFIFASLSFCMDLIISQLKKELESYNYRVIETTMLCDGIRIE